MFFKITFGEEKFVVPIKVTKQMTIGKLLEAIRAKLSKEMGKQVEIPQIVSSDNFHYFNDDLVEDVLQDGSSLTALTNEAYNLKYLK